MKYRIKVVTDVTSDGIEIVTYYAQYKPNWLPWWSYCTEVSFDTYEEAENYLKLIKKKDKYPIIEYYYI